MDSLGLGRIDSRKYLHVIAVMIPIEIPTIIPFHPISKTMADKPSDITTVGNIILIVHESLLGFSGSNGIFKINPTIIEDIAAKV